VEGRWAEYETAGSMNFSDSLLKRKAQKLKQSHTKKLVANLKSIVKLLQSNPNTKRVQEYKAQHSLIALLKDQEKACAFYSFLLGPPVISAYQHDQTQEQNLARLTERGSLCLEISHVDKKGKTVDGLEPIMKLVDFVDPDNSDSEDDSLGLGGPVTQAPSSSDSEDQGIVAKMGKTMTNNEVTRTHQVGGLKQKKKKQTRTPAGKKRKKPSKSPSF
jgi:hypothetical protein